MLASRKRLEETKKLLEETNRQFFSQASNDISFESLKKFNCSVEIFPNDRFFKLSKRQISGIPKRDIEWLKKTRSVIAYSINAKESIWVNAPVLSNNHIDTLFQLQAKGYRFIEWSNEAFLAAAKDCVICRYAASCPLGMKTSVICPATEKIENGRMKFSITKDDWNKLVKVDCEN